MTDIFDLARATEVFMPVGAFPNEPSKMRFVRAPFSLVLIPGNTTGPADTYLMPNPAFSEVDTASGITVDDTNSAEYLLGRENGIAFHNGDRLVLEGHQLGCLDDTETWKGCFSLGFI